MQAMVCDKCGSTKMKMENGFMVCEYCDTKFLKPVNLTVNKEACIGLTDEIIRLNETCKTELIVPLGITDDNRLLSLDIGSIPHILIGGTTGSGKTAFIQSVIASLVSQYGSDKYKLIIYDSKKVDYLPFNGCASMIIPLISDANKVAGALNWLKQETKNRIELLTDGNSLDEHPHLFCVIDDLADISLDEDAMEYLYEILRMGRTVKVHCIISTGLPLAKIIPSELKICVPCRIAFSTVSKMASRIIIDENGAELLETPGEMIFKVHNKKIKCRGVHISENEMQSIMKQMRGCTYDVPSSMDIKNSNINYEYEDIDNIFEEAGKFIIQSDKASIGMLQRKFRIGFNKATRVMDELEDAGVVSTECRTKPRVVLMSLEQFEQYIKENI